MKQTSANSRSQIKACLNDIERDPARFLIKQKPHRQVYLYNETDSAEGLVVKWFRPIIPRHKLRAALNPFPVAAREYWISRLLQNHQIPTAEPLVWFTSNCRVNSCFVAKLLPSSITLEDYLVSGDDTHNREQILSMYARLLASLHRIGLYVDDFGMHNVLVDAESTPIRLWLIDHEATRPVAGYFNKWRLKNLRSGVAGFSTAILSPDEEKHFTFEYYREVAAQSK